MSQIFKYTFFRILRLKFTLIYSVIVMIVVMIASIALNDYFTRSGGITVDNQKYMASGIFAILCFLWITGVPFIVMLAAHGTGLIANEESEGTLIMLVSKPIRRVEIIWGKFFGITLSAFIYQLATMFLALFTLYIVGGLDSDSLNLMVKTIPGLVIYSVFIILVFSSLSIAFSTFFKKKTPAMMIILGIIMLVFGVFPILRGVLQMLGYYESMYIYIFDINYHLGAIFNYFLSFGNDIRITPTVQAVMSMFIGIYKPGNSVIDSDIGAMPASLPLAQYITPIVLIIIWLGLGGAAMMFSQVKIDQKDIN